VKHENPAELIYAGKTIDLLSREELIECVLHFRKAHIETFFDLAKVSRRMEKMELALTKAQLAKLDWWLEMHPRDTTRGDGEALWRDWTLFELMPRGYRTKGDRF